MKKLSKTTKDVEVEKPELTLPLQVGDVIKPEQLARLYSNLERCAGDKERLEYKLSFAKKMFSNSPAYKSGKNDYQKFDYFELKDFVPTVIDIFCDLMLSSKFTFNDDDKSNLVIKDCETGQYTRFTVPTPKHDGGNSNKQIQDIGKLTTYTRRYAYLIALEIVENDGIDKESGKFKMTVDQVNKHMQETLQNVRDMDEAKEELNRLKMEDRISQPVYETVYKNITKTKGGK